MCPANPTPQARRCSIRAGQVDLAVGETYSGTIAQYPAFHPGSFRHVALVVTATETSDL